MGRRNVDMGGEGAVAVTASKLRRGEADRIALLNLSASLDLAVGCGMVGGLSASPAPSDGAIKGSGRPSQGGRPHLPIPPRRL